MDLYKKSMPYERAWSQPRRSVEQAHDARHEVLKIRRLMRIAVRLAIHQQKAAHVLNDTIHVVAAEKVIIARIKCSTEQLEASAFGNGTGLGLAVEDSNGSD